MNTVREMNKHYTTAQVGKDTIENAEYIDMNFSLSDRPQRKKTFKDKWYDLWYNIVSPFRKLGWKIEKLYWKSRYGCERMFKGYDSVDCFETFSRFTERYYKIFTEYKKNHHGYPCNLSENEWEDILDEMIYHLYYMCEENVNKELSKNVPEGWIPTWKTSEEIMNKHKDEFFKLFSKYFYFLWD